MSVPEYVIRNYLKLETKRNHDNLTENEFDALLSMNVLFYCRRWKVDYDKFQTVTECNKEIKRLRADWPAFFHDNRPGKIGYTMLCTDIERKDIHRQIRYLLLRRKKLKQAAAKSEGGAGVVVSTS